MQPSSWNTAVKKGLPARMLSGVLHSNLATISCEPTHTPARSKFGVSSSSHSRASRVRVCGGRECAVPTEAGTILRHKTGSLIQKTLSRIPHASEKPALRSRGQDKLKQTRLQRANPSQKRKKISQAGIKTPISMSQTQNVRHTNMDEVRGTPQLMG